MNRGLAKILWVFFGMTLFLFSFWLSLPSQWAARQIEAKLTPYMRPAKPTLSEFRTSLTGFSISQLHIRLPGPKAKMIIQNLEVSIAPWHLLLGRIGFTAELYQGQISGSLSALGQLQLEVDQAQPNRNLWVRGTELIRSNPKVSANLDMSLRGKPEGTVKVAINSLEISGKQEHTQLMTNLPTTRVKHLGVQALIKAGKVTLDGNITGDLTGTAKGTIVLNTSRLGQSQLNVQVNSSLSDAYKSKLGFIASLLQAYTNSNGRISISLTGKIDAPAIKRL